ncbi:hypothetical protein ACFVS9_15020 [Streptomyces sp. NPDC058008]|uniref:hypothetical protein n=1 Tax=Streptomyces sp. NPDC058008 TaxID=3346303 RepID=UPI0036E66062
MPAGRLTPRVTVAVAVAGVRVRFSAVLCDPHRAPSGRLVGRAARALARPADHGTGDA